MALKLSMLWRGKLGKIMFAVLTIAIAAHIVILAIFADINKKRTFVINYNFISRQISEMLNTLQQSDPDKLEQTIENLAIPNIKLSVDDRPRYEWLANLEAPVWSVQHRLMNQTPRNNIKLSVYLPSGKWLNVTATAVKTPWLFEAILLMVEILIVGAILISVWSINRFTEPLKKMRRAAERLGVDLHSRPMAVYGPAVVQDTAQAINQMQQRIRDLLQHRMQMLAALSHDLRTPLTRLKLQTHLIEDKTLQKKFDANLDQIEEMVQAGLAYVKEETRQGKETLFDLGALVAAVCRDYADHGNPVVLHCDVDKAPLRGRTLAIKRLLNNLLDNALKYAGNVTVQLSAIKKHYQIMVEDHGPGIPDNLKERVFTPFYRIESSRSRETGGTGLGLAIARDIVQAHHGTIVLQDAQPHGLRVIVTLPAAGSY